MKWIIKNIFQIMYWSGFIAYLFTKDIYFGVLQMTMLLAWYFDGRLGKVFNNTVNVTHQEDGVLETINNIEQMLSVQKPFNVVKGSELIFLKRITGDGKHLMYMVSENTPCDGDNYKLTQLSITHETYIAHGFNTYIVKLKK